MVNSWLKECANEHVSLSLNAGQALKKRLFTFRCWPPAACFFFPPVFQSQRRHDPFKWLFTCIRRRAKALLNELLSTIQLEWPSQQHSFPHYTMLSAAQVQYLYMYKYGHQRAAVDAPVLTKLILNLEFGLLD